MPKWLTRTVLSGSSIDPNGTNSHTCTFTAATAGNELVVVIGGAVTFTTPSGWTLRQSAINNCGLYVFTKTASSSESSFDTTHNSTNYAIRGVVYEFPSGTSYINGANNSSQTATTSTPVVSSLTGTYTTFSARTWDMTHSNSTASCAWTLPSVEDYDVYQAYTGQDGVALTIAYDDDQTGTSLTPSSVITASNSGATTGEGVAFALTVPAATGLVAMPWYTGING